MRKIPNGDILQTRSPDGEIRHWSVCRGCGYIDEIDASRCERWLDDPYCRPCEEAAIEQAEWEAAARLCPDADLL